MFLRHEGRFSLSTDRRPIRLTLVDPSPKVLVTSDALVDLGECEVSTPMLGELVATGVLWASVCIRKLALILLTNAVSDWAMGSGCDSVSV